MVKLKIDSRTRYLGELDKLQRLEGPIKDLFNSTFGEKRIVEQTVVKTMARGRIQIAVTLRPPQSKRTQELVDRVKRLFPK